MNTINSLISLLGHFMEKLYCFLNPNRTALWSDYFLLYCCKDYIWITKIFRLCVEVVFGLQKYLGCQRRWYFNFTFYPNSTITIFCTVQLFVIQLVNQITKIFWFFSKIFKRQSQLNQLL